MKTIRIKHIAPLLLSGVLLATGVSSCVNDLDTLPLDKDEKVSENVFGNDISVYTSALAKIYAGYAIAGNAGGDSEIDVAGVDGGSQASFLRVLWNLEELPTDMAHCSWSDPGIPDLNHISWSASSSWIKGSYYRLYYQIDIANAFLRETTEDKLSKRGVSAQDLNTIKQYRAEARFLRALAYTYALDLYRNVPFVDESSSVGSTAPDQISPDRLFSWIEQELLESSQDLLPAHAGFDNNYGHANQAAAWALLSRLYLNAEVYIGQPKYTESLTYSQKVIDAGYSLETKYADMFKADNHLSTEMIFPIRYDGADTKTWGGMTSLLSWGSSRAVAETNAPGAWQGVRAKSSLYTLFDGETNPSEDTRRSMLRPDWAKSIQIVEEGNFEHGIPVVKFSNTYKDGTKPATTEVEVDFPLIRLGEIYLNYAEAVLRGGSGGSRAKALEYVNALRTRAYGSATDATITDTQLTLPFLRDERGRELFFEAHRRTDLIRFGVFTTADYVWPWKGGIIAGKAVSSDYNLYPIPSDDIGNSGKLKQNKGY